MSTSITENYELPEKWDTETLIVFLKEQALNLNDDDFNILRKEKIIGQDFLDMAKEDFQSYGFPLGSALDLALEVKALKDHKKRSFSSYRSLKEVLVKYEISWDSITSVTQFQPEIHSLEDNDEELLQCVKEIKRRLANMGTVVDTNEAMRNSYIEAILHTALHLIRKTTSHDLSLSPQIEVVGEGRVDWTIKEFEDLLCITEGKQNLVAVGLAQNLIKLESSYQTNKRKKKADDSFYDYLYGIVTTATDWHFIFYTPEGVFSTSQTEYHISLTKSAIQDVSELRKGVKKAIEVIVGILKDRIMVEKEPEAKKRRIAKIKSEHYSFL
ncbi:hypothetical protein C2G38_2046905 [Gigaspora rosea]|uniref:SAM domain-containing protein n=1 Tax=Gigaspora rosea TaxID=44941 RepID=A0A397UBZ6_9GLOM|nr:hypothetical protein C2G38_2046905 [Gigaspora rosea]